MTSPDTRFYRTCCEAVRENSNENGPRVSLLANPMVMLLVYIRAFRTCISVTIQPPGRRKGAMCAPPGEWRTLGFPF